MITFPKTTRIVDRELLEAVRQLPCMGCSSIDPDGARAALFEDGIRSHPHHLVSVGHGGGDVPQNVMPLCFRHHREVHDRGLREFAEKYRVVKDWLETAGWKFNSLSWEEPQSVYGKIY